MLHGTIRNDSLQRNTASECCSNVTKILWIVSFNSAGALNFCDVIFTTAMKVSCYLVRRLVPCTVSSEAFLHFGDVSETLGPRYAKRKGRVDSWGLGTRQDVIEDVKTRRRIFLFLFDLIWSQKLFQK